jgi:membrane-bound lytic murein transglycosylase MltF
MKWQGLLLGLILPLPYQGQFQQIDGIRWVDRISQCYQESGLSPKAVSSCGAKGIAQFMPKTAKQYHLTDPTDVPASIRANSKYMLRLEAQCHQDWDAALCSYNAGYGNYQRAEWLAEQLGGETTWQQTMPHVIKDSNQPIQYVQRIHTWKQQIQKQLGR